MKSTRSMVKLNAFALLSAIITSTAYFPLEAQINPTLRQLDSSWRAFSGPQPRQAIVVYNKMAGAITASEHVGRDTLCIMRLLGSDHSASVKQLFPYEQCTSPFGAFYGLTSGYAISPDGSRIAAQNCHGVIVCDTSGSHLKVISTSDIKEDCIALCFDDSVHSGTTIRRIVYAAMPWLILRTTLSDTNTAVKTDTLWKRTTSDPCYQSRSLINGYTSVNKTGHYLSFNLVVASGICVPVVVDLNTREYRLPLGDCSADGCQIRSCRDTGGTVSFHEWSHRIPTTLWKWGAPDGKGPGPVPCLIDQGNCAMDNGDPGQGGYYWCETDTNYMIQVGDNDLFRSPGCYSKAYIRKGKQTNPPRALYLGDYLGWPALWIDPFAGTAVHGREACRGLPTAVLLRIGADLLTISAGRDNTMNNALLINGRGQVVARATGTSGGTCRFAISRLPRGIYVVSWQESTTRNARLVAITR